MIWIDEKACKIWEQISIKNDYVDKFVGLTILIWYVFENIISKNSPKPSISDAASQATRWPMHFRLLAWISPFFFDGSCNSAHSMPFWVVTLVWLLLHLQLLQLKIEVNSFVRLLLFIIFMRNRVNTCGPYTK